MFDHTPVQTVSPRPFTDTDSKTKKPLPRRSRDVLDAHGRLDLVARDDERAPRELLARVHEPREVDADLGVEHPLRDRGHRVDDREHRRRDDVVVARGARGLDVEVQRIGLADGARVLAHLLAPDRVGGRRVGLADDVEVHRHEARVIAAAAPRRRAARRAVSRPSARTAPRARRATAPPRSRRSGAPRPVMRFTRNSRGRAAFVRRARTYAAPSRAEMSKPSGPARSTPSAPTVVSTPSFGGAWITSVSRRGVDRRRASSSSRRARCSCTPRRARRAPCPAPGSPAL